MGTVDIDDLAEWWNGCQEMGSSRPRMQRSDVAGMSSGSIEPETSFLLQTRCRYLLSLRYLKPQVGRQESLNARSSPFPAHSPTLSHRSDVFERPPEELSDIVLSQLSSKDIANLRLASRTFYHLPATLWHDLTKKELPWIWEAWTDRPYPALACTTRNELDAIDEALNARLETLEALDGDQQSAMKEARSEHKKRYDDLLKPRPVRRLHRLRTDWYWLYCQINLDWRRIKGLQNRERIWKTLEFVVRRVKNLEEDVHAVIEEHTVSSPFRSERLEIVR
jgi:hypothetical protein